MRATSATAVCFLSALVVPAAAAAALAVTLTLALALAACGCAPRTSAELLRIDSVDLKAFADSAANEGENRSGDPEAGGAGGVRLDLVGEGFPAGRACEVALEGVVHRGGAGQGKVSLRLKGRALSDDRVVAVVEPKVVAALYRSAVAGSFQGRARVEFESADATALVTGELGNRRLDLPDLSDRGLKERRRHSRRARRFMGFAGVGIDENVLPPEGVAVSAVRPGSPAWAAGLRSGDVIVRSGGVLVRSLRDLAPEVKGKRTVLSVMRGARQEPVEVLVSLRGFDASPLDEEALQIAALLCLVMLVVMFFSPLAGFTRHMLEPRYGSGAARPEGDRAERRAEHRGLWAVWTARPGAASARSRPYARAEAGLRLLLAPLVASALLLAMVFCRPLCGADFDPLLVCLALAGFGTSAALMVGGGTSLLRRARPAAGNLLSITLACVPVGYACALGATRSLDAIVAMQGGAPWKWLVMKSPALALAFPVFVAGCARGYPFGFSRSAYGREWGWNRWADVAGGLVMCGVGAAVFLGGWQTAGLPCLESADFTLAGPALFLAKAWLLALLVQLAHERRMAERLGVGAAVFLILVSALITAAWIALPVSAEAEAVAGYALFATALAVAATALGRRCVPALRPRAKALTAQADPFL